MFALLASCEVERLRDSPVRKIGYFVFTADFADFLRIIADTPWRGLVLLICGYKTFNPFPLPLPKTHAMLFGPKTLSPDEFFPKGYVDIHSHLLPGLDDGAKTEQDSLALIRKMASFGIRDIITTPHILGSVWPNEPGTIQAKGERIKEKVEVEGLDVQLRWAAEYMLDERFMQLLQEGQLLTLKGNYLLVEMSYFSPPANLYEMLYELQLKGYDPVLAHPERYGFFHRDFKSYEKLKNHGCRFQLNLLSLTGHYGKGVLKTAKKLSKEGMIDFVGSDLHHLGHIGLMQKVVTLKNKEMLEVIMENNISAFR